MPRGDNTKAPSFKMWKSGNSLRQIQNVTCTLVRKGIALLIAVSLSGCISQSHAGNWRPQDASVNSNYDECRGGPSCMDKRGYRLREMTEGEIIAAVVLFPLWFPLALLTKGSFVRILGPNDKAP